MILDTTGTSAFFSLEPTFHEHNINIIICANDIHLKYNCFIHFDGLQLYVNDFMY